MNLLTILNPVDGSAHSIRSTDYAIGLARLTGANILLLHCHRRFPVILAEPHFQNAIDTIRNESEELLKPFIERLEEAGLPFEVRILEGSAGKMIPETARIENVDMIVMGSRGCTDLEGLILGSVTHQVLHRAQCPVTVIK